jgi:hypothetical protein
LTDRMKWNNIMRSKTAKSNAIGYVALMMMFSFSSDCTSLCRYISQPFTFRTSFFVPGECQNQSSCNLSVLYGLLWPSRSPELTPKDH